MNTKYVFGPVNSRRLGISLGIDLVPHKTCSLDCIYCECGQTTQKTLERGEFVPTAEVIRELENILSANPKLDFVTFSGSGEPTLHTGLGEIVRFIKTRFPQYKTALLTNGVHFTDPSLRKQVAVFDVIVPSLDAVSQPVFEKINRGCPQLDSGAIVESLVSLRDEFLGEIWLEIFIVPGVNDTASELALLKAAADRIRPNRIQFNSLDRPGTEGWVDPASEERLREILVFFGRGEIIAKPAKSKAGQNAPMPEDQLRKEIMATIQRRPCTIDDLSVSLHVHPGRIAALLDGLEQEGRVLAEKQARGTFFRAAQP